VPQERLSLCATCHGENGNSRMEKTPSLAGQPALFLTNQMILMRDKLRKSEVMAPFVKDLKDDEIIALSEHYAKLPSEPSDEPVDPTLAPRGAELARKLYCPSCHLPDYSGRKQMPRLKHQRLDYTIDSLIGYREGRRSGIDTSMNAVMFEVPDRDIRAIAHYLATLR
jgi:cytochrome c553